VVAEVEVPNQRIFKDGLELNDCLRSKTTNFLRIRSVTRLAGVDCGYCGELWHMCMNLSHTRIQD
jgi:hypothetical protein